MPVVVSVSVGLLGAEVAPLVAGLLSCTIGDKATLASRFELISGDLVRLLAASLVGDEGVHSMFGLVSSLLVAKPFRESRSRISSRLGSPLGRIRLVGEHAPEGGALNDKHEGIICSSAIFDVDVGSIGL